MIVVELGNYWIFVFWIAISIATIELSVKTAVKAQVTSSSLSSSSSSAIVASDIHHKPLRVAYVLAGSARSFIGKYFFLHYATVTHIDVLHFK